MSALRILAKRRFNYIDGCYLGVVGGLVSIGQYLPAIAVFFTGAVISALAEALDKAIQA